jgi:hypothetical protein
VQLILSIPYLAAAALALASAANPNADAPYLELVEKVKAGDLSIDFRALRLACAKADHCDAHGDSQELIAMRRAIQSHDYKPAIKSAEKLIAAGFPNIEAHAVCAQAYEALKEPDKAKFHHDVTSALIRSILSTGDGKTKETAFEVIGTQEEYLIASVLGLPRPMSQSLITGPHNYDLLEVDDPKTGKNVSLYFNIDAFFPMKGFR